MTLDDLEILIQEGEGTTLEFKERLSSSFARELVALANAIGGRILLGVRDDGTVIGIQDSNNLRARIQDIARNCDPPVQVHAEPVGQVVTIHVKESASKPVQCSEGFFLRQGAVTQKLSRDEIRDMFRLEGTVRFDLAPCPRFDYPNDFDRGKFDVWLSLSGITGQPRVEDILVNIGAAERANDALRFRNAGVLFFAKNPRRFFPQAYITCLLARGTDKVHILDRKDFDGGIVADIEDALRFVERNTRTAYRIEGLRRSNIPEYPTNALREAITNAVMHRDWFIDGANVFVEIYTDRIEVVSPGSLPQGLQLTDLGSRSIRRNALIADLLHHIDFIEKAGTGIRRIRNEVRAQGSPEPKFEANGFFTVTFRPNPEVRASGDVRSMHDATTEDTMEVTTEVTMEVTKAARLLQAITSEMGAMTRQELQSLLGLKNDEYFRKAYLLPALRAGLIEMTIPDKPRSQNQRYRPTPEGRDVLRRTSESQ
ncbi:MAG: transcriptional regulator [Caldilineaceae bacterium SB0664_bin_22]|nr:transcriptional regulator [Caldilineaceae bacterium SB0664_bin_22]